MEISVEKSGFDRQSERFTDQTKKGHSRHFLLNTVQIFLIGYDKKNLQEKRTPAFHQRTTIKRLIW